MSEDHTLLPISFEELLSSAPDAVVVHDVESRVHYWNRAAEVLYGWRFEEIAGRPISDICYLDAGQREEAVEALERTGLWQGELRQIDRAGREHLVFSRQQMISGDDHRSSLIVCYNADITEHKKREKAEGRTRYIQSSRLLASGIAHELNNVFAPIMLSSAMLQRSIEEPKARGMLSMIETCANKGTELVSNLLDYERGRGGGGDLIRLTQLERGIKKAIESLCFDSVKVDVDIDEGLWGFRADMTELSQVFKYIIENACEAMPGGGALTVQAANRLFDADFEVLPPDAKEGAYVTIVFTDTGHGIEEELLDRVAEPFFTTKHPPQGNGFGLAKAQSVIKGHKGFMRIESQPGHGTSLSLFLPADLTAEKTKIDAAPFALSEEGNGKLVLVADDEFFIRETIKKVLEGRGYSVLTAQDGTEALAIYASRSKEINLVVSNLEMPFVSGPALFRALRKLNPEVKLLLSSGHKQHSEIESLKAAGVRHFLAKPYTADQLVENVRVALGESCD